jgi:LysR family transcriptional regulator of abg operon
MSLRLTLCQDRGTGSAGEPEDRKQGHGRGAMNFEVKQLRHFVSVVDEGSITRAAKAQHISQPALTRSIRNMEERIGGPLLIRSSRAIAATEAGQTLYQYAQLIIRQAELAMRDVSAISRGELGHLHIGIGSMFAPSLIRHLIPAISRQFPGLQLRITEGFFEDLVEGVRSGDMDVIVSNFPPDLVPEDVILKPLFKVRTEFVAGARHPLAGRERVTTDDMRRSDWAIVKHPHIVSFLEDFFASASLPPLAVAVETSSLATLKNLVLMGTFVAMLPRLWIEEEIASGEICVLRHAGGSLVRHAGLITRSDDTQRPSTARVIPLIEASCLAWHASTSDCSVTGAPNVEVMR